MKTENRDQRQEQETKDQKNPPYVTMTHKKDLVKHTFKRGRLIWFFFAVKIFPETVSPGTRKFCSSYFSAPPSFTVSGKTLYRFQHMRQMLPHPPCSSPNYIYGFRQNLVPISTPATK